MPLRMPSDVAAEFAAAPAKARKRLKELRALILETGAAHNVGAVEETLKWGEPAYLCKGGSTVRIAWSAKAPEQVAMHFICTTNLVDRFRDLYPRVFTFAGNRSLFFALDKEIARAPLMHCIGLALTYKAKR